MFGFQMTRSSAVALALAVTGCSVAAFVAPIYRLTFPGCFKSGGGASCNAQPRQDKARGRRNAAETSFERIPKLNPGEGIPILVLSPADSSTRCIRSIVLRIYVTPTYIHIYIKSQPQINRGIIVSIYHVLTRIPRKTIRRKPRHAFKYRTRPYLLMKRLKYNIWVLYSLLCRLYD